MGQNLAVFFLLASLAGLVYWFGLRPKKETLLFKNQMIILGVLSLALLANALFAFLGWRGLQALVTTQPLRTFHEITAQENQAEVIVMGVVSPTNEVLNGSIVAKWACYDGTCYYSGPAPLRVQLRDGEVGIENNDFEEREWAKEGDFSATIYSLPIQQPVVIIAKIVDVVYTWGDDAGKIIRGLEAEIVFSGTHEAFVERARAKTWQPLVMMGLNIVAGVFLISFSLAMPMSLTNANQATDKDEIQTPMIR